MTRFAQLPPEVRTLWAKSGETVGHGLLCHMLDVAAVAETILKRESVQARDWGAALLCSGSENVTRWIAALVGLHDFGKAIPGFQAKWPTGQNQDEAAGLPFRPVALDANRHDLASTGLLARLFARRGDNPAWGLVVSQSLGAHHGYMPDLREVQNALPRYEGPAWEEARQALFDAYWAAFNLPAGLSDAIPPSLPGSAWLAGLTSVADWIGSNQDWFPPGERGDRLDLHYLAACKLAERALDDIGWPAYRPLHAEQDGTDALVAWIIGSKADEISARPLQTVADRLLADARGPTLMIVEAPMGEGKTELAFLAHLRLQALNEHRGLYVALPTQATGNAMFDRTLTFLRGFSNDTVLDIQLAHGGAVLDERVHRLRDVNASRGDTVSSSAWFSQRRRALVSPYGVGTIDQALFATLNVKHHFVRLWGLANRVVVLDEVHAYDTYTSGLIEALLRWLKEMNCSVVLMSATLPARRRAAFLEAWGARDDSSLDYPRVSMTCGDRVIGERVECRRLEPIEVAGTTEDVESLAGLALARVRDGGCGAVIVNTVQRAQTLYGLLKAASPDEVELLLFHARYPADERGGREKTVLDRFGRDGRRPARALLVATQVVEQSLDIDFDFMISDLAPVDLLLQRAGRLHRHRRERPSAHQVPRLTVAGLQADQVPELKKTAWGFVYDPYVLYRTWALVAKETLWQLPWDIDRLVQAVYGPEPLPQEEDAAFLKVFDEAFGKHMAETQEHRKRAVAAAVDAQAEPQNAYVGKPRGDDDGGGLGFRAVTRLGDDGVNAVPVLVADDGWRLFPEDVPFDPARQADDSLAQRIFRRQVRINRKDLVQALAALPEPAAFAEHPLLRHLKVLEIKEGAAEFGKLRVRLDTELGITYEETGNKGKEGA